MFKHSARINQIRPFYVMDLLARAQQLEQSGVSIVHMEVGEPDFPTPKMMVDAAMQTLAAGQVKYTAAAGMLPLREKIAEHYFQQYQVSISPQRIFVTPGASGAFILAMALLVNPGDEVLLPDPCYPCNRNFIHLFEGKSKLIAVDGATDYQLTADLLQQHWTKATCGTIIASPSNPTGTIMSAQQLQSVISLVTGNNGWVISDEIYHGLVYGTGINSALQCSDNALVINSFSKYFGMTGWRLGWLVVPESLIEAAEKLVQTLFISASSIAQVAAIHAFDADNLHLLEIRRQQFQERRDFLYEALLSLGFSVQCRPQGAFYIYAGCEQFSDDSDQFVSDLLENAGVAVTPGRDFGEHQARSHVRFAYTTSVENLQLGVERIDRFISR